MNLFHPPARFPRLLLALAAATVLSACQGDRAEERAAGAPTPAERPALGPGEPPAGVGAAPQGQAGDGRATVVASDTEPAYLTDAARQALYVLEGNDDGTRCDAECEEAWPPVTARQTQPTPGPGLQADLLGTMPRSDSSLHVTYDGRPLYRYAADAGAARTAGHGVEDQWGRWALVSVHGPAVPESQDPRE
ncbi:hypothetical protein H0E84_16315 [Luteimonas sp. SJ-92]|uniref:Lipoprotein with Yx(FWY)xxD motif n=1 Tax=Luteimonas salinisoli TaxID=2752307 RepID=A0A853JGG4_9GAMM|nr:hypothetical protein [Luteimonas salinisoli]NZA27945.1 hypothetical protein [Luteimonas salinisoli]